MLKVWSTHSPSIPAAVEAAVQERGGGIRGSGMTSIAIAVPKVLHIGPSCIKNCVAVPEISDLARVG